MSTDGIEAIDMREMALVCLVDKNGSMRVLSGMFSKRDQAAILRQAADAADRQADAEDAGREATIDERSRS